MKLYLQYPLSKRKNAYDGYIDWHEEREKIAYFFDNEQTLIATLIRPIVRFISNDGIFLTGFEETQNARRPRVQEWFVRFA